MVNTSEGKLMQAKCPSGFNLSVIGYLRRAGTCPVGREGSKVADYLNLLGLKTGALS